MARRGRPPHPDLLTPREQEVHKLLREGLSNPEIAERLGISLDGAKYHVSEILSKLGVSSREEAAGVQPEAVRPWWTGAFAPVAFLWRRSGVLLPVSLSSASLALSGVLLATIVAGLGVIAFLLIRQDGTGSRSQAPSETPALSATDLWGPVHSMELPREAGGTWLPMELLQGTRTFLAEFQPDTTMSMDERARVRTRMAFLDIGTGALDEFRTLDVGAFVGPVDNDGRYLVWVETGSINFTSYPWRMYAMELSTGEFWLIDAARERQGNWPWAAGMDVNGGRVIYSTLTYNAEGIEVNEIRLVDIESRTRTVIATPGAWRNCRVTPPSLSGERAVWLEGRRGADGERVSSTLYLMDLSTGRKRALAEDSGGWWPIIQDERVLYGSGNQVRLMNVETGQDLVLAEEQTQPESFTLVGDLALWGVQSQRGTFTSMVYDPALGEAVELGDPVRLPLQTNEQMVSWLWRPDGRGGSDNYEGMLLQWVELSTGETAPERQPGP